MVAKNWLISVRVEVGTICFGDVVSVVALFLEAIVVVSIVCLSKLR